MTPTNEPGPLKTFRLTLLQDGSKISEDEQIVNETSVTLSVNGEEWFNFLCTPLQLDALAVGFLFTSNTIRSREEIAALKVCEDGCNLDAWLTHAAEKPRLWQRNSGCSGGVSVPDLKVRPLESVERFTLSIGEIHQMLGHFYEGQKLYRLSGGVHASAMFSDHVLLFSAEDLGRHNTLDKIAGQMILRGEPITHPILTTTGRVSLEMMQKAAMIRAGFVISRTSPTAASIELAGQMGITLIGYAGKERMKIYTFPETVR
jgi:FdhD protein